MPTNFDWQTEEDERRPKNNWDEPAESAPGKPARRKLPWRLIIIVSVLVLTIGGITWWQIDRQIEQTLQALRTDVVASHNLVQHAIVDHDDEVFRSALSGKDPSWTANQMDLFQAGLIVDRSPLGLVPEEGTLPAILRIENEEIAVGEQSASIEFSADLNEAIVTTDQPYRVEESKDVVVLQQTAIFRRGDSRWLLAPPTAEFWGKTKTTEREHLTVIYPARDEDIIEMLTADIDAELGRMCATLKDIDCPDNLHLAVRFDTDPTLLISLSQPLGVLQRSLDREGVIELPTPTVAGLPVKEDPLLWEAGYASLRDGYARHILSTAIVRLVGWRCCDNALLFNALLDYQLGQLGLKEWSIGEADHRQILESRIRLTNLNPYLRAGLTNKIDEERLWEWHAAADFLINGIPNSSAAGIQRLLAETGIFDQFLESILSFAVVESNGLFPNNLDAAWWLYALNSDALTSTEPLIPSTHQELLMACQAIEGIQRTDRSELYRYASDTGEWTELYNLPGYIWMSALPDPSKALLQEFSSQEGVWRTKIWRDNDLNTAYTAPGGAFSISFNETDFAGERLLAYSFGLDSENVRMTVIDLNHCDENGCRTYEPPGRPVWSPDGELALFFRVNESISELTYIATSNSHILTDITNTVVGSLALGPGNSQADSAELTPLVFGRSPFWIDNGTYGFIRRIEMGGPVADGGEEIIVLGKVDDPSPYLILSLADLTPLLPASVRRDQLTLGYAATHPNIPNKLFITVIDRAEGNAYAFSYDLETGTPELHFDLPATPYHSLGFSPDGRYLLMTGQYRTRYGPSGETAVLLVKDLVDGQTTPFIIRPPFFMPSVAYDWTEDSRLLAMTMGGNLVAIVDPERADVQLLPYNFGSCTSVVWVNP